VGHDGTGDAVRPAGVLHRLSEAGRLVRRQGGRLPAMADQPECAAYKHDLLGSVLLSVLAGHRRYAHITSLRCDPDREASTTRPLLLSAIERKTQHAGQVTLTISSTHGARDAARRAYVRIAGFLAQLRRTAEQLDPLSASQALVSRAAKYAKRHELHGLRPGRRKSFCLPGRSPVAKKALGKLMSPNASFSLPPSASTSASRASFRSHGRRLRRNTGSTTAAANATRR